MDQIKQKLEKTSPSRIGKLGIYVILSGIGAGWFFFPYVLDLILGKKLALVEGTDTRILWTKLPPLVTKIYLFNVTNHKDVQNGAVPVLDEIGPYCFLAYKEKLDLIDDEESDTVSYSQRSTWVSKSSPGCQQVLTGDEMIVQPNAFLLALLLKAKQDFPTPLLAVVNEALPRIYGKVKDVFLTTKARDLLFDGVLINCTDRSLLPRAICIAIKQNSKPLVQISPNVYLFSYLGARNNTIEEYRYTVMRGTNNILDLGRMIQIDGKTELPFWKGECNRLSGTDFTIFPPYRRPDNTSAIGYSSDLCRILKGVFDSKVTYRGITGYKYEFNLGDGTKDPNQECYCSKPSACKKGTTDTTKCLGAPLTATFPHFYEASAEFERGVIGLNPNKESHAAYVILEPTSGVPLQGRRRIQINIPLKSIRYVPVTRKLKPTLCPLIWIEEGFDLDDNFISMLQSQLLLGMTTMDTVKWSLIVAGSSLAGVSAFLYSKKRKTEEEKINANQNDFDNKGDNNVINIISRRHSPMNENNDKNKITVNGYYNSNSLFDNNNNINTMNNNLSIYKNNVEDEMILPGMIRPLTPESGVNRKIDNVSKITKIDKGFNISSGEKTMESKSELRNFNNNFNGKENVAQFEKYFISHGTMTEDEFFNIPKHKQNGSLNIYDYKIIRNDVEKGLKKESAPSILNKDNITDETLDQRRPTLKDIEYSNSFNRITESETEYPNNYKETLDAYDEKYVTVFKRDEENIPYEIYHEVNSKTNVNRSTMKDETLETGNNDINKRNNNVEIFNEQPKRINDNNKGEEEENIIIKTFNEKGTEKFYQHQSVNESNEGYGIEKAQRMEHHGEESGLLKETGNEEEVNSLNEANMRDSNKKGKITNQNTVPLQFNIKYSFEEEKDELKDKLTELSKIKRIRKNWKKVLTMVQTAKSFRTYKSKEEMVDYLHGRFGEKIKDINNTNVENKIIEKSRLNKLNSKSSLPSTSSNDVPNYSEKSDRKESGKPRLISTPTNGTNFDKKFQDSSKRIQYPIAVNMQDILDDDMSDGTVTVTGAWSGPLKRRRFSRDSIISRESQLDSDN